MCHYIQEAFSSYLRHFFPVIPEKESLIRGSFMQYCMHYSFLLQPQIFQKDFFPQWVCEDHDENLQTIVDFEIGSLGGYIFSFFTDGSMSISNFCWSQEPMELHQSRGFVSEARQAWLNASL